MDCSDLYARASPKRPLIRSGCRFESCRAPSPGERPSPDQARKGHDGSKAYGFAEAPTGLPMCPNWLFRGPVLWLTRSFSTFLTGLTKRPVRTFGDEFADCSTPGESAQPSLIAGALSLSGHSDPILQI